MKLVLPALVFAAAGGVILSLEAAPARATPPRMDALQLCRWGGLELIDERCDATGACAKQSVRLAWSRGEGVLFEGDATGEKKLRRIAAPELGRLLEDLSTLRLGTDGDRPCWWHSTGCEGAERAFTITTDCESSAGTDTFLGAKPAWERMRDTRAECMGDCLAQSTWRAAFTTHLAVRFGAVFHRLLDAGRG